MRGGVNMLVLPIVNKRRVMQVKMEYKNKKKIRQGVRYDDALESEIIVNREKFSESSFKDSRDINAPIDFIRSKSLLYPRDFLVTTKEEKNSTYYDVYAVSQPPKRVNENLDKLYSKAITDLRKEIPGEDNRGRYISLEKLGIGKHLTDEKIATLQRIVKEERDESRWPELFKEAGIADLRDTIDFINNFECTVISDSVIPEQSMQDTLRAMSVVKTRDSKSLNNYYNMAKSNTEIYTKISYINKIIYDKPLSLIQSKSQKQKQLVKKMEEVEYQKVA